MHGTRPRLASPAYHTHRSSQGSQADHHQIYRHPAKLGDELYLITEAYADAGYDVFYWNGHKMASQKLNYGQGVPASNSFSRGLKAGDLRFNEILSRLERDPSYKAFIVTNFTVTHAPYQSRHVAQFMEKYPDQTLGVTREDLRKYAHVYRKNHLGLTWNHRETLKELKIEGDLPKFANVIELLYRANIHHLDRLFGDVVQKITSSNLLEESLIVFTADHGEVLYRESATFKWTHSMLLDHEVQSPPLMIHSPRMSSSKTSYHGVTRSIDVLPTMAGLSGFSVSSHRGVNGVDLSEHLARGSRAPDLLSFSHTTVLVASVYEQMYQKAHERRWLEARRLFPDEGIEQIWVAVRSGDDWFKHRKLEDGSWVTQAFDLETDPGANYDVFDPTLAQHVLMRDRLFAYKTKLVNNYREETRQEFDGKISTQRKEDLLRHLGYIE